LIILFFLFKFFSGSLFGRFLGYGVCFITSINVAVSFIFSLLIFYDVYTTSNIYQIFLISWIISEIILFVIFFMVPICYFLYINNILIVGTLLNSFRNAVSVLVIKALTTIIRWSDCHPLQKMFFDYSLRNNKVKYLIIFFIITFTNIIIVGLLSLLDKEKLQFVKTFFKVFTNQPFFAQMFIFLLTLFISVPHYLFVKGSSERVYKYFVKYLVFIIPIGTLLYPGGYIFLLYYVGVVVLCSLFVFPYEFIPSFQEQVNKYFFMDNTTFRKEYISFFLGICLEDW